jgi:hypothetical protein
MCIIYALSESVVGSRQRTLEGGWIVLLNNVFGILKDFEIRKAITQRTQEFILVRSSRPTSSPQAKPAWDFYYQPCVTKRTYKPNPVPLSVTTLLKANNSFKPMSPFLLQKNISKQTYNQPTSLSYKCRWNAIGFWGCWNTQLTNSLSLKGIWVKNWSENIKWVRKRILEWIGVKNKEFDLCNSM